MTRTAADRALDLVVDALAVYRITRLITADVITQPLRDQVISRAYHRGTPDQRQDWGHAWADAKDGDCRAFQELALHDLCAPKTARLVTCYWCASVWTAMFVVCARVLIPRAWQPVARAMALAAIAALTGGLER